MFIANTAQYVELLEWLNEDVVHPRLCPACVCIVSGNSGIGKSHGIQMAVEEANKTIRVINKDECTKSKDFKDILYKYTRCNVMDQFSDVNVSKRGMVIFIDDIETIL